MRIQNTLKSIAVIAGLFLLTDDRISADGPGKTSELPQWGKAIDPDGDCRFLTAEGTLQMSVPGGGRTHDLAADINVVNAPRVIQTAPGDFTLQVRIDGRFMPGPESTQPGRGGYNGAGIIAMLDEKNVVTLARAVIQFPGEGPSHYMNFEIRVDGQLLRIGLTSDHPIPPSGPMYLRLEGRGSTILGAVSADGINWTVLGSKEIPAKWRQELQIGLVAVSTSKEEFNPRFSKLQVLK